MIIALPLVRIARLNSFENTVLNLNETRFWRSQIYCWSPCCGDFTPTWLKCIATHITVFWKICIWFHNILLATGSPTIYGPQEANRQTIWSTCLHAGCSESRDTRWRGVTWSDVIKCTGRYYFTRWLVDQRMIRYIAVISCTVRRPVAFG